MQGVRNDWNPAVLARGTREGRIDGSLPALRVLVRVPEALVHGRQSPGLRVVPPLLIKADNVDVALLNVLSELVAPDPVAVGVAREEKPDATIVVPEDVRVDGRDVRAERSLETVLVRRRDEVGRGHDQVDVIVVRVEGVVVDGTLVNRDEGASGGTRDCNTDL